MQGQKLLRLKNKMKHDSRFNEAIINNNLNQVNELQSPKTINYRKNVNNIMKGILSDDFDTEVFQNDTSNKNIKRDKS